MIRPSFLFILILSFFLFNSPPSSADEGHIGEIRYSILTEPQFQEIYGPEWELMKGQVIPRDSDLLHLGGRPQVPDARGLFLRGCNHDRTGEFTDSDHRGLAVGATQQDSFKLHNHGGGSHRHELHFEYTASRNPHGGCRNTMAEYEHFGVRHTQPSGDIITPMGGSETRPKNLTVNIFIKLREGERAGEQENLRVTPELIRAVIQHPEFRESMEETIRRTLQRLE